MIKKIKCLKPRTYPIQNIERHEANTTKERNIDRGEMDKSTIMMGDLNRPRELYSCSLKGNINKLLFEWLCCIGLKGLKQK